MDPLLDEKLDDKERKVTRAMIAHMKDDLKTSKAENRDSRQERLKKCWETGSHPLHKSITAAFGDVAEVSQQPEHFSRTLNKATTVAFGHLAQVTDEHHRSPMAQVVNIHEPQLFADMLKSYRSKETEKIEHGLSTTEVGLAVASFILGPAALTIPFAFVLSGWLALLAICLGMALMLLTAVMLGDVLEEVESRGRFDPSYGDVGELTFGEAFKPVFTVICTVEVFFVAIFFVIFIGQTLSATFGLDAEKVVWSAAALGVVVTLIPKRFFSILSVLGVFLTTVAVAAAVVSGVLLFPDRVADSQSLFGTVGLSGMLFGVSSTAVAVGDHAVFPGLYAAAQDRQCFQSGLVMGYAIFLCVVLVLCITTYAAFGVSLDAVVLTNIGEDAEGNPDGMMPNWVPVACNILLAVRTMVVIPNFMKPMITLLQETVIHFTNVDLSMPKDMETEFAMLKESPGKFMGRLALICLSFFICALCGDLLSDFISDLETLISSLFKSINVFIIPCWGYWTLCGRSLKGQPVKKCIILLLVLLGVVWGIFGTISAVSTIASGTHAALAVGPRLVSRWGSNAVPEAET